jgi:hypothetical protein
MGKKMRKPTAPVSDNNSSGKGCFVGIFSLQRGLVGWVFFLFCYAEVWSND